MRKPKHHDIKILPQYFCKVRGLRCGAGEKNFELRKDDRDYQVGDTVTLHEWEPEKGYTGEQISVVISYVLRDCSEYGLMEGYCILGW